MFVTFSNDYHERQSRLLKNVARQPLVFIDSSILDDDVMIIENFVTVSSCKYLFYWNLCFSYLCCIESFFTCLFIFIWHKFLMFILQLFCCFILVVFIFLFLRFAQQSSDLVEALCVKDFEIDVGFSKGRMSTDFIDRNTFLNN